MNPPRHAVVVSIDEKSQIQALDRTQPRLADEAGQVRDLHTRLQAQRHHDPAEPVEASQRSACSKVRSSAVAYPVTDTRSSSASSRPSSDRAARQGHPRHPRQLCCPQAPRGAGLARGPSKMDVPLHADLVLMAQRRRRLLLQAHPAERRLPLRRRPRKGHLPLHRRNQKSPTPFV